MKNGNTKIIVLLIFIIVAAGWIIGFQARRLDSTLKELKVTQADKVSLEQTCNRLNTGLAAVTSKYNRAQESVYALEGELAKSENLNIFLKKKLWGYYKDIKAKEKAINEAESSYNRVVLDFNAQLEDLKNKISTQGAKPKKLNSSQAALLKQLDQANTKLEAMNLANTFLEKEIEELKLFKESQEAGNKGNIQQASSFKSKVEVTLMPQESK